MHWLVLLAIISGMVDIVLALMVRALKKDLARWRHWSRGQSDDLNEAYNELHKLNQLRHHEEIRSRNIEKREYSKAQK